ncbi:hypothetical protein [Methylocystis echinoides]|uniref:hypothetical protein n=1 Tax=Methylocystis echinoides TaxID=29468 RepID=UPI00343F1231
MPGTGAAGGTRTSAAWLEGLSERQKTLARLCALKADDAHILDELERMLGCYTSMEKPWCFLSIEALLPAAVFWRAFHLHWRSFEQPPHGRYLWTLGRRRPDWRIDYMTHDDAAALIALPEILSLYRGRDDQTRVALSWKVSEPLGERRHKEDFFIEARAPKAAVAGFYAGAEKREAEVVLFSCRAIAGSR